MSHRVHSLCTLAAFAVIVSLAIAPTTAHAQEAVIQHSVFGSGGGMVSSRDGATMQGTVGQPAIGRASNANTQLASGFWYLWGKVTIVTAVENDRPGGRQLPLATRLHANAPNPFNPSTTIRFDLSRDGSVRLELFDLKGRRVAVMIDAWMSAGEHQLIFRPQNLSSGTYFYRLVTPDTELTRRMVLVR